MDFQAKKAIYLQIADYVFEHILLKRWREGSKIPSVRELAVTLAVNPNTVLRAYAYLEEKNIIATQRGIGYFISDDALHAVIAIKKKEFLTADIPQIMRAMQLLQIDLDDFKEIYNDYIKAS